MMNAKEIRGFPEEVVGTPRCKQTILEEKAMEKVKSIASTCT